MPPVEDDVVRTLVTGPRFNSTAVKLAEDRGADLTFMPAYTDEATLKEMLCSSKASVILSRMGRVSANVIAAVPAPRVAGHPR